jgi:hypothetical protein
MQIRARLMVGDNAGFNDLVTLFYSGLILE